MNDRSQHTHNNLSPASESRTVISDPERAAKRVLRSATGLFIALLVVPIAAALVLFGCGGQQSDQTSSNGTEQQHVVQTAAASEAPVATASTAVGEISGDGAGLLPADEPPSPDVTASVADTTLQPGRSVEVTAITTEDVRQVVLWDGIHDRKAFAYDSTSGAWRASYRMPLRGVERVALSVTAFNENDRWSRVWVFVHTPGAQSAAQPELESNP